MIPETEARVTQLAAKATQEAAAAGELQNERTAVQKTVEVIALLWLGIDTKPAKSNPSSCSTAEFDLLEWFIFAPWPAELPAIVSSGTGHTALA